MCVIVRIIVNDHDADHQLGTLPPPPVVVVAMHVHDLLILILWRRTPPVSHPTNQAGRQAGRQANHQLARA